jgi:hypothetical protein
MGATSRDAESSARSRAFALIDYREALADCAIGFGTSIP